MKNFGSIAIFSLFFFFVGCCSGPTKYVQAPIITHQVYRSEQIENVRQLKNLTVGLVNPNKESIHCSAIWIKQGFLLTAWHCVDAQKLIMYVTDNDDPIMRLSFVNVVDETNDIAILVVDPMTEPQHNNVILTDEVIESGEEVHVIGHTAGYGWTYSKGYVSAIRKEMIGPSEKPIEKVIQISAPIWLGNSGGGAFDSAGHFIGLCSWISTRGPFLTFFIHKDVISKFLEKEGIN